MGGAVAAEQRLSEEVSVLHAAAPVFGAEGQLSGAVVATDTLKGEMAARSRRMTQAFEQYNQLRVLKRPLTGVYLSFFIMVTQIGRAHV